MTMNPNSHTYRSIWISDTHLGSRGCKAELLLSFLQHNQAEHIYLVGDIIDGWALRKRWIGIDCEGRAMLAAAILANGGRTEWPLDLAKLEAMKNVGVAK